MKKYEEPMIEVITFAVADILTTSGSDEDWGYGPEAGNNETPIG